MGKFIASKYSNEQPPVRAKRRPARIGIKRLDHIREPSNKKRDISILPSTGPNEQTIDGQTKKQQESCFQDLRVEVATHPNSGNKYVKLVTSQDDLFAEDDLKASYEQHTKYHFISTILDEVALEGLDGITVDTLWKRLEVVFHYKNLPPRFKDVIWKVLCLSEHNINFYELPEARPPLVFVSTNLSSSNNDASSLYPVIHESAGNDIYKFEVAPKDSGEWGACSTLNARKDVSFEVREMASLKEAIKRYGNKLVMVANEKLRKFSIMGGQADPHVEFTLMEYCILERIGRARHYGEISSGPTSLSNCLNMDPKSLFHYCKLLNREKFISKQQIFISLELNKMGSVFHLRRFYYKKKTKSMLVLERLVQFLKKCPDYRSPYTSLKAHVTEYVGKRLTKHSLFQKCFDTDIFIPYRSYYTDATYKEYMQRNQVKERYIQMIQLKDPYINIAACYGEFQNEESSDEEEVQDSGKGRRIYKKDLIKDVYDFILSKGLEGVASCQFLKVFDVDRTAIRVVLKRLLMRKLIVIKKLEVNRQAVNQYYASCFTSDPNFKIEPVEHIVRPESSSVLARLKERQRKMMDSVSRERIYTKEQFEAEHMETDQPRSINLQIPQIFCQYFTVIPASSTTIVHHNNFLTKFDNLFQPFILNLTYPSIDGAANIKIIFPSMESSLAAFKSLKEHSENIECYVVKPDYFSKVILLKALLDNLEIDQQVIDFLDPNRSKKRPEKRPIGTLAEELAAKKGKGDQVEASSVARKPSLIFLGSNPMTIMSKTNEKGYLLNVQVSTPDNGFKKGDISQYETESETNLTDRGLSRIKFILKTVQQKRIIEDKGSFIKMIANSEKEKGSNQIIDRKSLYRILKRLTDEGYLKVFLIDISKGSRTRNTSFVCHPEVTFEDPYLQTQLGSFEDRCVFANELPPVPRKPKNVVQEVHVKKSPFVQDDVLRSINAIKEITTANMKQPHSVKVAKTYGRRPKFPSLAQSHELLFYLIYELPKDTKPLAKSEVTKLFQRYNIKLTTADLKSLPPVYCNEISWKTFLPPMPKHMGWKEGWALLIDVILRTPMIITVRFFSIIYVSQELQEILQHPIKRFYVITNLSPTVRSLLQNGRKYILACYQQLIQLSYCGLVQFGPHASHEKEKSFIYLNRNAILWDTVTSAVGYFTIEEKDYRKIPFYFGTNKDVKSYWSTMRNICLNTHLDSKSVMDGQVITMVSTAAKPELNKLRDAKTQLEAKQLDTGYLPGDNKGAAGLDSSLWAHKPRNWVYKLNPVDKIESIKSDEITRTQAEFDTLKFQSHSTKYYLTKPAASAASQRKIKRKAKAGKGKVKTRVVKAPRSKGRKAKIDEIDRSILRMFGHIRYRPSWTEREEKILMLLKIGVAFFCPNSYKQAINYCTHRDILHALEPLTRDKTSSVKNRFRILHKSIPILANMESVVLNLFKLPTVIKYFLPFRNRMLENSEETAYGRIFKLPEVKLRLIFIFLIHYMVKNRREIEVAIHGKRTTTDYFSEENSRFIQHGIEPFEQKEKCYSDPRNETEVKKSALKNIIHSALVHKKEKPAWFLQMYSIYQRFTDDTLRVAVNEMKQHRMIQGKMKHLKFFAPYRMSVQYIIAQSTTFIPDTVEEAYTTFLNLKYDNQEENDYSFEAMEINKYGQMFAINEILSFALADATITFKFPEQHLVLNPDIQDHSEIIEELAKRYQAMIRNEQKEAEQPEETPVTKPETEDFEMSEPQPGPSQQEQCDEDESDLEIIDQDDEPLDLSIDTKHFTRINSLKHWISDCIVTQQVRSPSPELDIKHEPLEQCGEETTDDRMSVRAAMSLKEIKEEMLKTYDDATTRIVPYISDLMKLLPKNSEEDDSDETMYNLMRTHFTQEFPGLEGMSFKGLIDNYVSDSLENRSSLKDVWVKVERASFVGPPNDKGLAFDDILAKGGTVEDIYVACNLISYIESKNVLGATGYELKINVSDSKGCCSLEFILDILIKSFIILRAGVTSLRFVHHKYRDPWLVESFILGPEQERLLPSTSGRNLQQAAGDIESEESSKWLKIKALPWATVEGDLDRNLFKTWLTNVFSYCIEAPSCLLTSVCDKFCFLQPVDVFYLVEILEEIGCVELRKTTIKEGELFMEYEAIEEGKATFLDKFEEIYIVSNNVAFIALGSFFQQL